MINKQTDITAHTHYTAVDIMETVAKSIDFVESKQALSHRYARTDTLG